MTPAPPLSPLPTVVKAATRSRGAAATPPGGWRAGRQRPTVEG